MGKEEKQITEKKNRKNHSKEVKSVNFRRGQTKWREKKEAKKKHSGDKGTSVRAGNGKKGG